jgi:hypothetical protein
VDLPKDTPVDDYEVKACAPKELSRAELESCFAIIGDGGAVNVNTMRRDLPNSSVLAIARTGGRIIGAGAIKPVRKTYAAKVAKDSGVQFPPDTLELGYVAVQSDHRNRGLSHRIASVLVSSLTVRLFATTDEEWMKRVLSKAGFVKKAKNGKGGGESFPIGKRPEPLQGPRGYSA